jgi:DnaJ-class molecular chaperone
MSEATKPRTPRQVPCPSCGGQGRKFVTREMAIDAGDRQLEGTEWGCSNCNGDGWILEEIEPGGER